MGAIWAIILIVWTSTLFLPVVGSVQTVHSIGGLNRHQNGPGPIHTTLQVVGLGLSKGVREPLLRPRRLTGLVFGRLFGTASTSISIFLTIVLAQVRIYQQDEPWVIGDETIRHGNEDSKSQRGRVAQTDFGIQPQLS